MLEDLQQKIANSCAKRTNYQHNVRLIAVSKRQPTHKIQNLVDSGHLAFAENQVQEACEKIQHFSQIPQPHPIEWHMIGTIQSRKCRLIAEHFDWVQSVDREKIAKKLSEYRASVQKPLQICIQVNLFDEMQKSGTTAKGGIKLAQYIETLPHLQLRGIMALPPKQTEEAKQKQQFDEINRFYDHLKGIYPHLDTLSMGMSNDLEPAILAGSSMVRVGTALFGDRSDDLNKASVEG